ncbi:CCA tRNA nucleotidyltransferase [Salinicoccus halodurans]|uniref:tRNA nucleotidyltransferase (CCA-adding enzyme) n=1 Tax=Salinicoccus halodurans TaxID=407035 RepID=A0A0F7HKU3_9STAP|nr:CCA tRNA nucleotidyltransferase [Salinicoccus halodurans]AKG74091.1 hypothetical protein AAT16_07515 [Salinicoccus halodurans]SFK60348.1 tRNA nucleotidyltransferase (CCA-adding enzyme) [Salinicoccus halodurans]
MDELFITGKKILEKLQEEGFQAYFVGGCVRDYQMGRIINDVDITTNALPEEVETLFENTVDVGKEHGTVIVLIDDTPFEVTTFRVESEYTDHRRPDFVSFTEKLDGDLERRDFTMNAMAMDKEFRLIDPYAGLEAIRRKTISTVGRADERFDEDALRILRAVRFKAQLDFEIDEATLLAMKRHAGNLRYIAVERSLVELKKTYDADYTEEIKPLMIQTGVKDNLPFLREVDDNNFMSTNAFSFISETALQVYMNESLLKYIPDLKLSNLEKHTIREMVEVLQDLEYDKQVKAISYKYNYDTLENVEALVAGNRFSKKLSWRRKLDEAMEMQPLLPIQKISDIDIGGKELMLHFGQNGGRWIREIYSVLEYEILFNELQNEKTKILEWIDVHVEFEEGNIKLA